MDIKKFKESKYGSHLRELTEKANSLRAHKETPIDVNLAEMAHVELGEPDEQPISFQDMLLDMGIDPSVDTVANIMTSGEHDARWVVPEIFLEALRLGLRKAPIWSSIIAKETNISQLKAIMPYINMSDAAPMKVNEAETIPTGTISYNQKEVNLFKIGRGIKLTYEIRQYVSLDVLAIFLEDFGVKLGHALDTLAIHTLINGEQIDGSAAADTVGVTTAGSKAYKDYLRIWIRLARMGRVANTIIGGEAAALETLDLEEFKTRTAGTTHANLTLKTPVPKDASYYIHGNIPEDQEIILDPQRALIKFNAQPLLLESEKIVSNQTEAFYVTMTTGFATLFQDARLILDKSDTIENLPFPDYMDVDVMENITIE